METFDLSTPIQVLRRDACEALLRSRHSGRVAYVNGPFPMILPVNFELFDEFIVFRTGVGSKLANIPMRPVAFEVDGRDGANAWSVVVVGHAREVTTALGPRYDALRQCEITILAAGDKTHWIAIEIEEMTGREFCVVAEPTDRSA
ncbi:MAG: hypothetical protein RLZZ623_616 [Actinomycetota bacterium]|jgi:uncharacterized protein